MASIQATEAERMARVPGIIFADGGAGRRARIAGRRIEVHDVIRAVRMGMTDGNELAHNFDLTVQQVDAALRYYELYPETIDEWLAREDADEEFLMEHEGLMPDGNGGWRSFKTGETGLHFPSERV